MPLVQVPFTNDATQEGWTCDRIVGWKYAGVHQRWWCWSNVMHHTFAIH